MALPNNTLSSEVMPAAFLGGRALTSHLNYLEDFEDGGRAFQDPTGNFKYQTWHLFVENDIIYLESPNTEAFEIYSGTDITEVSFTFDRNINICIAFVEEGIAKLYWYSTIDNNMVVTVLGSDIKNPRVTHDDKRENQGADSDIVLAYLKEGKLYLRNQRDRYTKEYDPLAEVPEPQKTIMEEKIAAAKELVCIGMNFNNRVQFKFRNDV